MDSRVTVLNKEGVVSGSTNKSCAEKQTDDEFDVVENIEQFLEVSVVEGYPEVESSAPGYSTEEHIYPFEPDADKESGLPSELVHYRGVEENLRWLVEEDEVSIHSDASQQKTKYMENTLKYISKQRRNSGLPYLSARTKKPMKGRSMKEPCTQKCRVKCWEKFTEAEREEIFRGYWALADLQKQRHYIANRIEKIRPLYRYAKEGSNRKENNAYYFTRDNRKIRVCKTYFINTLDISDRYIRTVIDKIIELPTKIVSEDMRGRYDRKPKSEDYQIALFNT